MFVSLKRTPIATAVLITLYSPAYAQQPAPQQMPKIGVQADVEPYKVDEASSPKYTQPLRDTPQTVVVIPSEVFQEQGQTSLREVVRNTPGITFQAGEGGNAPGDNLFIRGFGARNDVYIDGVRDPGVTSRDTFNVDSVEVAKGPSSSVSGRGSTGGAVNLVSKTATHDSFIRLNATGGNADYKRATFDANEPLSEAIGARLNAVWTDAGVAGRDEVKNKNWGIAPSLVFGLGTPTRITFNYEHVQQDNLPDYGLPMTLPATAVAAGITVSDLDWSNFYGLVNRDYEKVKTDIATIFLDHDINDNLTLRNVTHYGRNVRDSVVTPPRAAAANVAPTPNDPGYNPALAQIRRTDTKYIDRNDRIVANQTNLTIAFATGSIGHTIATGVEVSREESIDYIVADRCVTTGANPCPRPPVTSLYSPNPFDIYNPQLYRTGAYTQATADDVAVYAFDTLKFNDHWQFTGGARWESFDVDYTSVTAVGTAPNTTSSAPTNLSRRDDMFSWRAGLIFKPVEHGSIYAGIGTSFNPSADGARGLTLATTGVNNAALAPERNRSTELGTKWDLMHERLALTAAIFKSEKTNAKTTDAAGNTVLAGDQEVKGVELGISGSITRSLAVFGGYSYMQGKVNSSGVVQQNDAALQYVPKHTLSLWSTYRLPARVTVGAGAQFNDGYYYALPAAPTATAPNPAPPAVMPATAYWAFNAMASYEVNRMVNLRLNVNNLTDRHYVERGYSAHFTPAPTRSILGTAEFKF